MATRKGNPQKPGKRELVMTRIFDAPREVVWFRLESRPK
jgi:hypothetical protein